MSAVLYHCLRAVFLAVGRLAFRFTVVGRERIPREGGLLVVANHASYFDIPVLGCALPRRAFFLGRYDLFPKTLLGPVLQWLGWIPIKYHRLDREGFGRAIDLIKQGRVVVIYPEGTRSIDGRLGPGKPGVGVIVAETGCPVLPAYLDGVHEVLPVGAGWPRFCRIQVRFGSPIDFSDAGTEYSGKRFFYHVGRIVMDRIAELGGVPAPAPRFPGSARAGKPESQPAAGPRKAE